MDEWEALPLLDDGGALAEVHGEHAALRSGANTSAALFMSTFGPRSTAIMVLTGSDVTVKSARG